MRFELVISSVTGKHVRPLHQWSVAGIIIARHYALSKCFLRVFQKIAEEVTPHFPFAHREGITRYNFKKEKQLPRETRKQGQNHSNCDLRFLLYFGGFSAMDRFTPPFILASPVRALRPRDLFVAASLLVCLASSPHRG